MKKLLTLFFLPVFAFGQQIDSIRLENYFIIISKQPGLGVFARKLKARRGAAIAIKATARKLAELYYEIFAGGMEYVEKGAVLYEQKIKEQQLRFSTKKVAELNMQLVHN